MDSSIYDRILRQLRVNGLAAGLVATALAGAVAWTVSDFYAWKAFGTGGTPPTWAGYWRMTKIRISHALSSNDLLDPSSLATTGPSYLKSAIAPRRGPRPKIMARIMPQRQHPTPIEPSTRDRLQGLMRRLARENPSLLEIKPSHTEGKSTDGLYARRDVSTLNPLARDKILDHEIAHAHPAENSLHVWLSDVDERKVIEAGWGQRFPLTFVKSGWTMVYAPRNDQELAVIEAIVKAGVGWVTGATI